MLRSLGFVFLVLGFVAAPVSFDGATEAQAQQPKTKRITTSKKGGKAVKGTVKKGVGKTRPVGGKKIITTKKGAADDTKVLFVKRGIRNTNIVLNNARQAVKAGAKGADLLRNAVIRQHAARKAHVAGKPRQAFYLTRAARSLAREAIALNGLKVEIEKDEEAYTPTPEDMEGVDEFIKAVEDEAKVPALETIADDQTIGIDLPEDLGEDEGVVADPGSEPEVEVEQN